MRDSRGHCIAENFPVLTEVIGIHHPVGNVIGINIESTQHGINAIVLSTFYFCETALCDTSATEEHRFDFATWCGVVKLFVDMVGDVFVLCESLTTIIGEPACHSIRCFTASIKECGEARHTHYQYVVAFAVSHHSRVTITRSAALVGVIVHFLAITLCHWTTLCIFHHFGSAPRFTIIFRTTHNEVYTSVTDVACTWSVARIAKCHDSP